MIRHIFSDLLHGASFAPFAFLAASIVFPSALTALLQANRMVLALSGIIAALYVVHEFISAAWGKPKRRRTPDS